MVLQRVGRDFKSNWAGAACGLGRAVISVFVLAFTMIASGVGAESGKQPVHGGIAFNIPSQPLGTALEAYARISSREVLYDGALALGRRSSLVDGVYAPEVALQILLAGTGLWADFKDADFFIVGSASAEKPDHASAGRGSAEHARYYGRLQASLRTAFCGGRVLPDGNRVAARLWVGQWGQVLQVKELGSTGSGELDQQVETVLRGLRLGGPPPVDLAQPITIVIMPGDATHDCDSARQPPGKAGP
jgi:hypothetical protein